LHLLKNVKGGKEQMEKIIKRINSPNELSSDWDKLANYYFQKKEFLSYLHKYNPCSQRYYELYCDNKLTAATVVFTIKFNILTFVNIPSPLKVQIIGLPVSVASPPVIGDPNEFEYLLSEIINLESGLIFGINFQEDHIHDKVVNMRSLPTIILRLGSNNYNSYENSLRHDYRRRIHRIKEKFAGVTPVITDCSVFNEEHYSLYMQIMKKTTTKVETLSYEAFRNLPSNFRLTTYYIDNKMLCWHIVCKDNELMFFYFGGMNYSLRDNYQSYNNNLIGIVEDAFEMNYGTIDLGQTAEIAKTRLGGVMSDRRMFFYHKNPVILGLLRIFRNVIAYTKTNEKHHVFKFAN
jgi:hypothetical protein